MGEQFQKDDVVTQKMSPEDIAKKDKEEAMQRWMEIRDKHIEAGNKAGIEQANEALRKINNFDNTP